MKEPEKEEVKENPAAVATEREEVFFEEDVKDILLEDTKEISIGKKEAPVSCNNGATIASVTGSISEAFSFSSSPKISFMLSASSFCRLMVPGI